MTDDAPAYYVFNENESPRGGFVIVAGNDIARPILGYSENGHFDEDNLPPAFVYWMESLQGQIEHAIENNVVQSVAIAQEWEDIETRNISIVPTGAGTPLIKTKWNQRAPYFNLTPLHNGLQSLTGCVATAQAQIMNYWQFPKTGSGSSLAYTTPTHRLSVPSVNRNIHYDWDYMSNTYPVTGPDAARQNDAVATLMYHVGASSTMDYGNSSSGALFPSFAAFGYNTEPIPRIRAANLPIFGYTEIIPTAQWEQMLRDEINAGRPVYYTGTSTTSLTSSAHAFICDGYDDSGMFHFNWGWGGNSDGYYVTSALDGNYTFNQTSHINVQPNPVLVTNISLNKTSATIQVGGTDNLTATVLPSNSTDRRISWSSSDTSVATVLGSASGVPVSDTGLVTAVGAGTATITAAARDGSGRTATFIVTVPQPLYTIVYNLNGGTGATGPSSYTAVSATITLGTPTRPNSIFMGWYETANFSSDTVATIPTGSTGNKTFWAKWFCIDGYFTDSATTCSRCPHIPKN